MLLLLLLSPKAPMTLISPVTRSVPLPMTPTPPERVTGSHSELSPWLAKVSAPRVTLLLPRSSRPLTMPTRVVAGSTSAFMMRSVPPSCPPLPLLNPATRRSVGSSPFEKNGRPLPLKVTGPPSCSTPPPTLSRPSELLMGALIVAVKLGSTLTQPVPSVLLPAPKFSAPAPLSM
jgi:hypothetical protein